MNRHALAVAAALFSAGAQAQDDPVETHVYNIEFLTRHVEDWPGVDFSLAQDSIGTAVAESAMSSTRISGEDIASLIKNNIAEDTWDHVAAKIGVGKGLLTVTNRKSVHVKIQVYLDYWRSFFGKMIAIESHVVAIEPAPLARIRAGGNADRPAALSPEQLRQVLDLAREGKQGELLRSMRVTAHPGQRIALQEKAQVSYVRDHDVQIATSATVLDPVIGVLSTGGGVDVRPYLEPFGDAVTLEVRGDVADLEAIDDRALKLLSKEYSPPPPEEAKGNGAVPRGGAVPPTVEAKVQLPRISHDRVRTTTTIRNRETFIAAATFRKGRQVLHLLTPAVVSIDDRPVPEPAFEEQRLLRLFDISPLTRGIQDFAGPRIELSSPQLGSGVLTGATFTLEEPAVLYTVDDVIAMIKSRIAGDTWGNKRNTIHGSAEGTLFIRQKPEVLKEIEAFLSGLVMARAQMITTEAAAISFRRGARAEWEREIPALAPGGYLVEDEKFQKLLEEAWRGRQVRLLETGEITGYPQQRVYASRLQEESYVSDYEPQVSTFASMYDPVIGTLASGFVLDVRPHFIQGMERIAVDVRCSLTQREAKEADRVLPGLGAFQLPRMTGMRWNSTVTCAKGRWTCVALESRGRGEELEEIALFLRARANLLK